MLLNRIVLWLANELGLELNDFIMDDNQTYYLVNGGTPHKTYEVKQNPDILNYDVLSEEKNKSADELLQLALQTVGLHGTGWKIPTYTFS